MCQNKTNKPILIRDEGGVQTFRDPETGKEFSTTISKPIPNELRDSRLISVRCIIRMDEEIPKQLTTLRSIIDSEVALDNHQVLAEARAKGAVTISGLRIWRAEEILAELKRRGFSAEVIRE